MLFRAPPAADVDHRDLGPTRSDRRWFLRLIASVPALSLGAGCSNLGREAAVPQTLEDKVTVLGGLTNARFWPDTEEAEMTREAVATLAREEASAGAAEASGKLPPVHFLAVSGGGDDGPYGAGLLCGWTDSGKIPDFKLVTGVSTGSMIAPFAFLGRSYVDRLRTMYTTIKPDDIMDKEGLYGAVFSDALADSTPLYRLISRYVDEQVLADIANAYNRGRLLLIGTTSLDDERPVLWNIGAIAASGRPGALELVRKVILASAAVPGAFPPVMIDVEAAGRRYQEMNVDGGAVAQMFLYPPDISLRALERKLNETRQRRAYLILNGRLDPGWQQINRSFMAITGRAISTMIRYSSYNDILRIYNITKRDGVDYNLTFIESDFPPIKHDDFDPAYMKAVFEYGYQKGRNGIPWHKAPPIIENTQRPRVSSSVSGRSA